jgi:hypothetical protein
MKCGTYEIKRSLVSVDIFRKHILKKPVFYKVLSMALQPLWTLAAVFSVSSSINKVVARSRA